MVVRKKKKVLKYRGSKTHGGGSMKKRRGAGHRGGRGRAGSGTKGDAKKPTYQKEGKGYMGKHGFTSIRKRKINTINISDLQNKLETFLSKKLIIHKAGAYSIDLAKIGYNKLLGKGNPIHKMNITADFASKNAVEKIEKFGGKISVVFESSKENEFEEAPKQKEEKKEVKPLKEADEVREEQEKNQ